MNKRTKKSGECVPEHNAWLEQALAMAVEIADFEAFDVEPEDPGAAFRDRCRAAAEAAAVILKLRQERKCVKFSLVAFSDYIGGLAKTVGASLEAVEDWFGLADLKVRADSATALARLARAIGCSIEETLERMQIDFCQGHADVLRAHNGGFDASTVTSNATQSYWPLNLRQEFESITKQVETVYRS